MFAQISLHLYCGDNCGYCHITHIVVSIYTVFRFSFFMKCEHMTAEIRKDLEVKIHQRIIYEYSEPNLWNQGLWMPNVALHVF